MGSKSTDAYQARLAWEKHWGKKIPKGYIVHHKNGDPTDNRPSNLAIVTIGRHNTLQKKGKSLAQQKRASKNKPNKSDTQPVQRRFR